METKQNAILAVLRVRGLNRFEAEEYGDHTLNSTISILRGLGYKIYSQWEEVQTRFGKKVRVKRYFLLRGPRAA